MKSVSHTGSFSLDIPAKDLFPLFSPEGEKAWVPGWVYENLMDSTELCEDYMFNTRSHDNAAENALWIVKKYDPKNYLVQYYKIEFGNKLGIITVLCLEINDSRTEVRVSYEYRSLSKAAKDFITTFDKNAYAEFLIEWQNLLREYFSRHSP